MFKITQGRQFMKNEIPFLGQCKRTIKIGEKNIFVKLLYRICFYAKIRCLENKERKFMA